MLTENPFATKQFNNCWLRHIQIILKSDIVESDNYIVFDLYGGNEFDVEINGKQQVSSLSNKGTVAIHNLEYDVIAKIMIQKYYNIEIKAGYQGAGPLITYFKGYVYYISQKVHSKHDTTTYIHYADEMVAKWGQVRLTYNYNSGINIYTAIEELTRKYNLPSVYLNYDLKNYFLDKAYSGCKTLANFILDVTNDVGNEFIVSAGDWQTYISISSLNNARVITIDPNIIDIQNGNPKLASIGNDTIGLNMTIYPMIELKIGDVIKIENSLLDFSISDAESVLDNLNQNYIDPNGEYLVIQMNYAFQNRGETFKIDIMAISMTNVIEKVNTSV